MFSYSSLKFKTSNLPASKYQKWILGFLWVVQTLLVIPRVVGLILIYMILLFMFLLDPGTVFIVGLVLGVDLVMCISILVIVWKQFLSKKRNPSKALKREMLKSAFATYTWVWPLIKNPGGFFTPPKQSDNSPPSPQIEKKLAQFNTWITLIDVLAIVAFYPTLWLVYMEWRDNKKGKVRGNDLELQDEPEHQIRLVDRTSIDDDEESLSDFVGHEEASQRAKPKF